MLIAFSCLSTREGCGNPLQQVHGRNISTKAKSRMKLTNKRKCVRAILLIAEGLIMLTFVLLLCSSLLLKRDAVAASSMSRVTQAAFSPTSDEGQNFLSVRDVIKHIKEKFYPAYLQFFLDDGNRIALLPDGNFSILNNFTALGGLTPLSPLRIRALRVRGDSGCDDRPSKFNVVPCIPSYDAAFNDKEPIRVLTSIWNDVANTFEYFVSDERGATTEGKAKTQAGASIIYPNEGHVLYPNVYLSIEILLRNTMSRAYDAVQAGGEKAKFVQNILDAVVVTDDDMAAASTAGLEDLLAGVEGYHKDNNLTAPSERAFLSKYTRATFVEFSVLNPNMGNPLIGSVMLMFEFSPFGGVKTTFKMQPFQTNFAEGPLEKSTIAFLIVWVVIHVIQLVEKEIARSDLNGGCALTTKTSLIAVASSVKLWILIIMFCIFATYSTMLNWIQVRIDSNLEAFFKWKRHETDFAFPQFGELQQFVDKAYLIASVGLFLTMFPLLHFLGRFKFFAKHIRLVRVAAMMLASFSTLFVIMIVFYAMLMHLQLAVRVDGFESFSASLLSVFRMLVGDFPFNVSNADNANDPQFSMFLFVFFSILYVWMSLNVFVAILGQAQEIVNSEPDETEDEENLRALFNAVFGVNEPESSDDCVVAEGNPIDEHSKAPTDSPVELAEILREMRLMREEMQQQRTLISHLQETLSMNPSDVRNPLSR